MKTVKTGTIFDVQRYSLHDGPGIRTLIFMKGCPLRCLWCSNPESQSSNIEVGHLDKACIKCGACFSVCQYQAIQADTFFIDKNKCINCGECAKVCRVNAKKIIGEEVTVESLMEIAERDRLFYRNSGGGITIGGGEPLMQADFVAAFLKECKNQNIHTAIETCGFASEKDFRKVLEYVDVLLFDLKHMNTERHKEVTGVGNELILSNAKIAGKLTSTVFRIPLIPGINDEKDNLISTFQFAKENNPNSRIEILPYHNLGVGKYNWISKEYVLNDLQPFTDQHKQELRDSIKDMGLEVDIVVV